MGFLSTPQTGSNTTGTGSFLRGVLKRLAALGLSNPSDIGRELDHLLIREKAELGKLSGRNILRFRTAETVVLEMPGWFGWGVRGIKVTLIRTVRAAITGGYRVKVRAITRGVKGSRVVKSIEVDLLHRAGQPAKNRKLQAA